jgi:hypothetical protein
LQTVGGLRTGLRHHGNGNEHCGEEAVCHGDSVRSSGGRRPAGGNLAGISEVR